MSREIDVIGPVWLECKAYMARDLRESIASAEVTKVDVVLYWDDWGPGSIRVRATAPSPAANQQEE